MANEMRDWLRKQGFPVGERGRLKPEWTTAWENRSSEASGSPQIVYKVEPVPEAAKTPADVTDPARRCLNPRCQCIGYLKGKLDKHWQTCANCHCCEQTHTKGE